MPAADWLHLALRRWYVVLACMTLTLAAAVVVGRSGPVFWARATVVVVRPATEVSPNALQNQDPLTPVASMVVLRFNEGVSRLRLAQPDAPLYGMGVKEGTSVQVRNLGSQWKPQINAPNIDIQAVDHTSAAVTARVNAVIAGLDAQLRQLQDEFDVPRRERLSLALSAPAPALAIYPNPKRARVIVLAFGAILTLVAVRAPVALTRRRAVRSSRRPRRADVS